MPRRGLRKEIATNLELLGYNHRPKPSLSQQYLAEYEHAKSLIYQPINSIDGVTDETLGIIAYFAEIQGLNVVLGEIPEIIHKLIIANSMSRLQLSYMLKGTGREAIYYPDYNPNTPWGLGSKLFPELLVQPSDKYQAALLQALIPALPQLNQNPVNRILVVQTGVQSSTSPEYLRNRIFTNGLLDTLTPPEWKVPITQDFFIEEILEKFSILDVMTHGDDLFTKFKRLQFKSTYSILEKYASPSQSTSERDELRYLHVQLMKKHHSDLQTAQAEAERELQKLYLSEAV
jgi:hypothetical protein